MLEVRTTPEAFSLRPGSLARAGRASISSSIIVSVLCLAIGAGISILSLGSPFPPASANASASDGDVPTNQEPASGTLVAGSADSIRRVNQTASDSGMQTIGSNSDHSAKDTAGTRQRLSASIEATLFGVVDASEILDSVLDLTNSPIDLEAVPDANASGTLRYPLKTLAPGVARAEFFVKGKGMSKYKRAVSLHITLAPSFEPYVLEGALRSGPEVEIMVGMDDEGNAREINLLTAVPVSPESIGLGVRLEDLKLVNGVSYSIPFEDPSNWKTSIHGIDHGRPSTWDSPVSIVGAPWPNLSRIQELTNRLNVLYDSVQSDEEEHK